MPALSPIACRDVGIHYDVPDDTYRAWDAISYSGIKDILQSPAHYVWRKGHPFTSDAMVQGRATHTCVLQPDRFEVEFVWPKEKRAKRSKADKEWWADFEAQATKDGKQIITVDQYDMASRQRDAVHAHPIAGDLLAQPGKAEVSIAFKIGDVACKSRVDYLLDDMDNPCIVDLKTCMSASPRAFRASVFKYHYHIQVAFYMRALWEALGADGDSRYPSFTFVAVEKKPPYHVGVYRLDNDMFDEGDGKCVDGLAIYAECQATGTWPGYNADGLATIQLTPGDDNDRASTDDTTTEDDDYIDF